MCVSSYASIFVSSPSCCHSVLLLCFMHLVPIIFLHTVRYTGISCSLSACVITTHSFLQQQIYFVSGIPEMLVVLTESNFQPHPRSGLLLYLVAVISCFAFYINGNWITIFIFRVVGSVHFPFRCPPRIICSV